MIYVWNLDELRASCAAAAEQIGLSLEFTQAERQRFYARFDLFILYVDSGLNPTETAAALIFVSIHSPIHLSVCPTPPPLGAAGRREKKP